VDVDDEHPTHPGLVVVLEHANNAAQFLSGNLGGRDLVAIQEAEIPLGNSRNSKVVLQKLAEADAHVDNVFDFEAASDEPVDGNDVDGMRGLVSFVGVEDSFI